MHLIPFMRQVLALTKPYRARFILGMVCGILAGFAPPLLMGSVKLVVDTVFPQPGAPGLLQKLQKAPRVVRSAVTRVLGSSTFSAEEITVLPTFVNRLRRQSDPISAFLWQRLSNTNQVLLTDYQASELRLKQAQHVVIEALNKIIEEPCIYERERFKDISLRPETTALMKQAPTGYALAHLNRLLLEEAYPLELSRGLPSRVTFSVRSSTTLTLLIIATVPLVMLLRGLFTYLNTYLMNWVSIRAINDLRARLFEHLMGLSSSFFSDTSTGTLMAHLNAAAALQSMIGNSLVVIIREPVSVVGMVIGLIWLQPKLSLIALVVFPLTLIPFVIYARKVRGSSAALQQQVTEQSKLVHESLTGYRIIKAYNLEATVQREFVRTSQASIRHTMRVLRAQEIPGPLIEFFGSLGVAAFFIYIALFSHTTPGGLLYFVGGIFLLYQPIKSLIRLHSTVEQAQAATQYMFQVLATKSVIEEPAHPKPLHAAGKDIVFDRITFSYGEKSVLHDVTFQVKAGLVVALVGSSGSGKTTLTNLLLRFYDPQQGAIRIGDTDLREMSTNDLRGQIAVVTQETILFNDTILRNIELGRPGATKDEIMTAAKHAYAHDFIMEKPLGYETLAGEKGVNLSGGQRQRLAIARAILKNAPILILDEATSSLDTESERIVQEALEKLMQGRTTICIAHRLSTVQRADLIVVLDRGRIVETGTHAELLRAGRTYTKLYELQFEQPED